ncbi:MAG: hypothetical protein WCT54_04050 [Patescibacteria group bacterium]
MICRLALPNDRYGYLMPPEDAMMYRDGAIAVGDGITRDASRDMDFKKRSIEELLKTYPNPSGARFAADLFCEAFTEPGSKNPDPSEIKKRFINANARIAKLNSKSIKRVDYLVNDFYGCAAAGVLISDGKLFWGVIADCGVIIYSKTGKTKFQSPNSMATFEKYTADGKITFKWETEEGRRLVRSQYRNNPTQTIDGVCVSYGALTGEKTAEPFICTGVQTIGKVDLIIVYSDGFEPLVKRPDFFKTVYNKSESIFEQKLIPFSLGLAKVDYEKYGKERSLIATIY